MLTGKPFELVCPAGALPALKAAVDNGADCVYTGLKDNTNARNFTGLNFDDAQLREGIRYAHDRRARVLLALSAVSMTTGIVFSAGSEISRSMVSKPSITGMV